MDRGVIVLAPFESDTGTQGTTFHEFVHHLFRLVDSDPPRWFNEGTAEVVAGIQVESKKILIGTPLDHSAALLRERELIPLTELFSETPSKKLYKDEEHTGIFYSESWALLHYLYFGDSGFTRDSVEKFISVAGDRQLASEVDLPAHFRKCFGCSYEDMERRLRDYVHRGSYRTAEYPRPKVVPRREYAMRTVEPGEANLRLAELAVRVQDSNAARLLLLNAFDARQDSRVPEALGASALFNGDPDKALEYWESAVTMGSTNPALVRELGLIEGAKWLERFDSDYRMPEDMTARLRSRLLHSIEIEPRQQASYEMLAWVEAAAIQMDTNNINRVVDQLPKLVDRRHTLVAVAWVMVRAGLPQQAAPILNLLYAGKLDERDQVACATMDREMRVRFPNFKRTTPEQEAAALRDFGPPAKPGLTAPSVALPEDL